jgi:phenylacetaldehyde dehydrogenase
VGLDLQTEMGLLVSEVQHSRVTGYLEAGFREGAKAVTGGAALNRPGFFVKPTVLVDTKPANRHHI